MHLAKLAMQPRGHEPSIVGLSRSERITVALGFAMMPEKKNENVVLETFVVCHSEGATTFIIHRWSTMIEH